MLCIAKNCFVQDSQSCRGPAAQKLVAGGEIPDTAHACIAVIYSAEIHYAGAEAWHAAWSGCCPEKTCFSGNS